MLKHLTDEEIQDYLDGNIISQNELIEGHLENCELCQDNLQKYRKLYAELARDVNFALSPHFAETVISKLPQRKASLFGLSLAEILTIGITVPFMLFPFIYLISRSFMTQSFTRIAFSFSNSMSKFWNLVKAFSEEQYFSILFLAGCVLLVVYLVDKFFLQNRFKAFSFSTRK